MEKFIKYIPIIFVMSILTIIFAISLRYYQKFLNNNMKEKIWNNQTNFSLPLTYTEKNLLDSFKNLKKSKDGIDDYNFLMEENSPLINKLNFFESVNKVKEEVRLSNNLLKKEEEDEDKKHYLEYILSSSINKEMKCFNFENARYKAQRFVNNEKLLNPLDRDLTYARKVIKLSKFNLYNFNKDFLQIINSINKKDDGFLSKTEKEKMIKILQNNINI